VGVPCAIKLLKAPKNQVSFHDFGEFDQLVDIAQSERWLSTQKNSPGKARAFVLWWRRRELFSSGC